MVVLTLQHVWDYNKLEIGYKENESKGHMLCVNATHSDNDDYGRTNFSYILNNFVNLYKHALIYTFSQTV